MKNPLQALRALRAFYSFARLAKDPNRLDEVFEVSDALATPELMQPIVDEIKKTPSVARAFVDGHRIAIDLKSLAAMPEGSFGRAYADHMIAANLDPGAIPTLPAETEIGYFRAHLYETHDIWHVATGFGTDWKGELGLQAFYLAQIPGSLPAILLAVGFVRVALFEMTGTKAFVDGVVHGWKMGRVARPFFGVRWDELFPLPVAEVRAYLGIEERDVQAAKVPVPLAA